MIKQLSGISDRCLVKCRRGPTESYPTNHRLLILGHWFPGSGYFYQTPRKVVVSTARKKELRVFLNRRVFGKEICHYFCLESTNKIAYSLAKKGAEEGTVVVADEQTQGEGRGDRYWYSPQGGLWFSLILRPCMVSSEVPRLSILGALGIAMSIDRLFPSLKPRIRWPNDVVIKDKKVAGVLVKVRVERDHVNFAVMGIGVNLNIRELPSPLCFMATSLIKETGHSTSKKRFLEYALEELENLYFSSRANVPMLLEKARLFSSLLGQQVEVVTTEGKFRGLAQDLDEDGGLILRLESGIHKRISSEEGYIKERPQKI